MNLSEWLYCVSPNKMIDFMSTHKSTITVDDLLIVPQEIHHRKPHLIAIELWRRKMPKSITLKNPDPIEYADMLDKIEHYWDRHEIPSPKQFVPSSWWCNSSTTWNLLRRCANEADKRGVKDVIDLCRMIRDVYQYPAGKPYHLPERYLTDLVVQMATEIYQNKDWALMPILADVLRDEGLDDFVVCHVCQGKGSWVKKNPAENGMFQDVLIECGYCKGSRLVKNIFLSHLRGECEEDPFDFYNENHPDEDLRKLYRDPEREKWRKPLHIRGCWALDCILYHPSRLKR